MSNNIIKLAFAQKSIRHESDLVKDIKALVYSYAEKMSIATAFGCIQIADDELKKEIYEK